VIAIHNNLSTHLFHYLWIEYCKNNNIHYKLVNCYDTDIIEQLADCNCLMFHFSQSSARDITMAKQLLFSLEQGGFKVFPDFNTSWHFDDKVGQKYLLEALEVDLVKTWAFYDEKTSLEWITKTTFPKVFKLRGGAGSQNVQLVHSKKNAQQLVKKAFGKGFPAYDGFGSLKERFRKWKSRKVPFVEVIKGIVRLVNPPRYAKVMGNEINYLYFQEFVPNNDSDIRIIVIDGKAFGIKRMNRENDFRASGSGFIRYDKASIDDIFVRTSFEINKKLKAQCVAYDFVLDENKIPLLIEISYGFANAVYNDCPGYWDENLVWYEGKFNPYGWMVDLVLKKTNEK
jgi:glutathione synthase/RimK-type ligase-like ATP-grasp enzyme